MATKTNDVTFELPTANDRSDNAASSDKRIGSPESRSVLVREDGEVLEYDQVAGHYSRGGHTLTEAEHATAREFAASVRAGTHYVSGKRVWAKHA